MTKPSLSDYGTYDESTVPRLWDGVVGAWCPSLGPTGSRLRDFSRSNNWGTLTNMDAATDWVVDGGQYALDFDGVNDYVTIPFVYTYASGVWLSASVWFRRNVTGAYHEILNKFNGTGAFNEDGWLLRVTNANNLSVTIANSGTYHRWESTVAYADTAWHHVAFTLRFGSGGTFGLWHDGAPVVTTLTGTGNIIPDSDATNYAMVIGAQRYAGASENLLNGQVSDAVVWQSPLSAETARQLYLLGRGGMFQRRRVRRGYVSEAVNRRRRLICGAEC